MVDKTNSTFASESRTGIEALEDLKMQHAVAMKEHRFLK